MFVETGDNFHLVGGGLLASQGRPASQPASLPPSQSAKQHSMHTHTQKLPQKPSCTTARPARCDNARFYETPPHTTDLHDIYIYIYIVY